MLLEPRREIRFRVRTPGIATWSVWLCWLWGFGLLSHSEGAEWSVQPSLNTKAYYNSNLFLLPLPHKETYGYWISPAAEIAGKTERLEVSSKLAADFVTYYGEERQFTNMFLPLSLRYKTEADEFGFTGGFTRDNTLMGELLSTGVVLRFTQRNQWNANPTWTRSLTEKLSVQSTVQFTDTSYQKGLSLGLVDYQLIGGSTGLSYQLSDRDQLQLTGTYVSFHTTNGPFALSAVFPGAIMGITHAFSESFSGTVSGGPRFISATTELPNNKITAADTVWIYNASLMKKFERTFVQATLSREIVPSGFGLLLETNKIGMVASYNLTEFVTASLDTSYYIVSGATNLSSGATLPEFKYTYVTPRLTWQFSEWWKLDLSYTYGSLRVSSIPELGTSNSVSFVVAYTPPKWSYSH